MWPSDLQSSKATRMAGASSPLGSPPAFTTHVLLRFGQLPSCEYGAPPPGSEGCQQSFSPRYSQTYGSGRSDGVQWLAGVDGNGKAVVVTVSGAWMWTRGTWSAASAKGSARTKPAQQIFSFCDMIATIFFEKTPSYWCDVPIARRTSVCCRFPSLLMAPRRLASHLHTCQVCLMISHIARFYVGLILLAAVVPYSGFCTGLQYKVVS